jgi:creatinine amidohydrolase
VVVRRVHDAGASEEERVTTSATRHLADLTAFDVLERCADSGVALLPIGAVEQHGPHLPLSTDLITAQSLCERVCDERGDQLDLWLLPALAYSKSNEHLTTPGTFSLSASVMLATLDELGASLRRTPIRKLAILNGHGGNSSLLDVACRDLRVRHGLVTFLLHTIVPPDQGGPSHSHELGLGIHAGEDETSLMLHLAPHLVRMERATREIPEWLDDYEHIGISGAVRFGWTADDLSRTGVVGDPTKASAERGELLFEEMIRSASAQLAEVSRFAFAPKPPSAEEPS